MVQVSERFPTIEEQQRMTVAQVQALRSINGREGVGRYVVLPLHTLRIDRRYQRDLKSGHVERMVKNFDAAKCEPLQVAEYEDPISGEECLWVWNGQHRKVALTRVYEKMGVPENDITHDCLIHPMTYQKAAYLFLTQLSSTRRLETEEKMKAGITAEDPGWLAVDRARQTYDFPMRGYSVEGIKPERSFQALMHLYKTWGASRGYYKVVKGGSERELNALANEHVSDVIYVIKYAWPGFYEISDWMVSAISGALLDSRKSRDGIVNFLANRPFSSDAEDSWRGLIVEHRTSKRQRMSEILATGSIPS